VSLDSASRLRKGEGVLKHPNLAVEAMKWPVHFAAFSLIHLAGTKAAAAKKVASRRK
jgi:hypothetical protein